MTKKPQKSGLPAIKKKPAPDSINGMANQGLGLEDGIQNSLSGLVTELSGSGFVNGAMLSQTATLMYNLRHYLISNNRQLLADMYVEHGIVQTLVDQPVDDAFRSGFVIESDELDPDEIKQVLQFCEEHHVIDELKLGMKWGRLFGGGGLMFITPQDMKEPFNIENITEYTPIVFRSCDLWELYTTTPLQQGVIDIKKIEATGLYQYYGNEIHPSHVIRFEGKQAPSFVRPRLRGWGMSVLERLVRSINQFLKNQDVTFELLDEAKVDIFKMKGFNAALANDGGTEKIAQRVQMANQIKNFQNSLTMDADDDYEQKQITFSGLSDVIDQIRMSLASDVKMPLTKLFGISAAGFSSGEDDIENYNSMIEGEIRSQCKYAVIHTLKVVCQKVLGFIPDDLQIRFNPLRVLSAEQEEKVKKEQYDRVVSSWQSGLITTLEAKQAINVANLLPIKIEENDEVEDTKGSLQLPPEDGGNSDDDGKKKKDDKKPKNKNKEK